MMRIKQFLNWCMPKWVRRTYCTHIGYMSFFPTPGDLMDMGSIIGISCLNCGQHTERTAYNVMFEGWDGKF